MNKSEIFYIPYFFSSPFLISSTLSTPSNSTSSESTSSETSSAETSSSKTGFQYGKRKISAMPNEEFNKLTFNDMMSNARSEMQASIPTMQAALEDMKPLVTTVVREFLAYIQLVAGELTGTGGAPPPAHDIGRDIGTDILAALGLTREQYEKLTTGGSLFPSLPGALGDPGASATVDLRPSTIPGLSVKEAQSRAIQLQKDFVKEQDRLRRVSVPGRIALSKTSQPVPQVRAGTVKRPAGQSQRIERKRLIRLIALLAENLKSSGFSSSATDLKIMASKVRFAQQALVNLLARYTF